MRYKWLLFDADGTLFDFDRAEASALCKTLEQFGVPFTPERLTTYQRINNQLWRALENGLITTGDLKVRRFESFFEELQLDLSPHSFSLAYLEQLGTCSELIAGAVEILQALHTRYQLAIVTNGLKAVQRSRLARSPIRDYIAEMVVSEEVGASKPDQAIFDAAFERIGRPLKSEALMIGDSLTSDMEGGYRYGVDTCWYNPTNQSQSVDLKITYQIGNLAELANIL
ncbi:MAG TPA: YjjG family noncanonical pyrimidine nucleotidase [Blastocatellia bacterium]|jgi:2-haloacid dehalogenase